MALLLKSRNFFLFGEQQGALKIFKKTYEYKKYNNYFNYHSNFIVLLFMKIN